MTNGHIDHWSLVWGPPVTVTEFKKWLKKHQLTNLAAAKLLDVEPRTVGRWVNGERRLPRWLPIILAHVEKDLQPK